MSIFGRRDNAGSPPSASGGSQDASSSSASLKQQQRSITHIAPGSRVRGEISGATELLVEGEVEGEIRIDAVVRIGTEGLVQGPITAQVVRVGGRVVGDVTAADRVEVAPSGTLEGNIAAPRIVIAEGAFFKGQVEMKGEKAEETRRARRAAEPEGQPQPSAEPGNP
jgi:cytoskeletal protein CcmA (bactofilin family)